MAAEEEEEDKQREPAGTVALWQQKLAELGDDQWAKPVLKKEPLAQADDYVFREVGRLVCLSCECGDWNWSWNWSWNWNCNWNRRAHNVVGFELRRGCAW